MATTPEKDWHYLKTGLPWMQKTRPGLRTTRPSRSVQLVPLPGDHSQPTNPVSVEQVMPANSSINRLLHEAHVAERENFSSADGDYVLIVAAIVVLAIYWGSAALAANSAINHRDGSIPKTLTLKYAKPMGGSSAAISAHNHAAESANPTRSNPQ